jgi:radical SAM superfamily enzyme YgiQ (UPF0313 family)
MQLIHALSETSILLTTLNAKFIHASLGLRYLRANLGELRPYSTLVEFTIKERPIDIVERILKLDPKLVGFGVYIWNVVETLHVVQILKQVRPEITVVLGGPEVSYEVDQQEICALADFVITGAADHRFRELCEALYCRAETELPKIWPGEPPPLETVCFPYDEYTEADLAHRLIYVEASRGCAFKCEFCLSSLDKTAWPFPLPAFMAELKRLRERGTKHFKFVDRTFNLKVDASIQVLDLLLEWIRDSSEETPVFAHFEVIPDHLPERLLERMTQFPPGTLQLEIGYQTFNPEVQERISRRQNDEKALANLTRLLKETHAHIHCDLIFGLPGETLESFGNGFDRLIAVNPHEIQVGILKRLRGTPIIRHTETFKLRFDPRPPYSILCNSTADFTDIQRISRFARYWDMIGNSGRFFRTRSLILGDQPFSRFLSLTDRLFEKTRRTFDITYETLIDITFEWLTTQGEVDAEVVRDSLAIDYAQVGARGFPACLEGRVDRRPKHRAKQGVAFSERQSRVVNPA